MTKRILTESLKAADRFICRREGHKPTVVLFKVPVTKLPYFTTCQRCGKWYEAEPQEKP